MPLFVCSLRACKGITERTGVSGQCQFQSEAELTTNAQTYTHPSCLLLLASLRLSTAKELAELSTAHFLPAWSPQRRVLQSHKCHCQPSPGFHLQSNRQMEHLNQEMETALWRISSHNPARWAKHLLMPEYTHATLPSSATSLSPFQCTHSTYL